MGKDPNTIDHKKRPWLTVKDIGEVFALVIFAPFSWLIPVKWWKLFSRPAAMAISCVRLKSTKNRINAIRKISDTRVDRNGPFYIEITRAANVLEQKVQYLREYRPGGFEPRISVRGTEFIENSLKDERGVILWVAPFFFNNLIIKKGLYQSGYRVTHLSAYNHGPSLSRFGIRFVNMIYINVENRYLKERVVIKPARKLVYKNAGTTLTYIRELEERLSKNKIVSMSCQPDPALEHQGALKKMLGGRLLLAKGAPSLALACNSALIPVFTVQVGPDRFEIDLQKPMVLPEQGSRREKVDHLLDQFMELVENYTVRFPTLFRPWHELTFD